MEETLKDLVPEEYLSKVKAYLILKSPTSGSTSFQNVVIATEDGKLIEFSNKYIINKCAIDMKNVNMISLFKVYNPNLRYFLLYDSSSLHIISTKNNTFKIERNYDFVGKFKIFDFWKKHFPQVGIWFNSSGISKEPDLITIFQEEINPMQDSIADALFINNRRELELEIDKAENEIRQQRTVILESSLIYTDKIFQRKTKSLLRAGLEAYDDDGKLIKHKLSSVLADDFILYQHQLAPKDELKSSSSEDEDDDNNYPSDEDDINSSSPTATLLDVWQRHHAGKWILGYVIRNTGKCPLSDVNLLAHRIESSSIEFPEFANYSTTQYNVKMFTLADEGWNYASRIQPDETAYLLAILAESDSADVFLKISGVIFYRNETADSDQVSQKTLQTPPMLLKPYDYLSGRLVPFTSPFPKVEDLLSVKVSSEQFSVHLLLTGQHSESIDLGEFLVRQLNFTKYLNVYFHSSTRNPALNGTLIELRQTSEHAFHLNAYVKKRNLLDMFLLVLRESMCHDVSFQIEEQGDNHLHVADTSVEKEIEICRSVIKTELTFVRDNGERIATTSSQKQRKRLAEQARRHLTQLEYETDKAMQRAFVVAVSAAESMSASPSSSSSPSPGDNHAEEEQMEIGSDNLTQPLITLSD